MVALEVRKRSTQRHAADPPHSVASSIYTNVSGWKRNWAFRHCSRGSCEDCPLWGASGSGKTAALRALDARDLPGVRCYYFDSIGVPSREEMERDFGAGENWQALATERWLDRLAADPDSAEVYVLDGQTRPSFVRSSAERVGVEVVHVVLLDCAPPVRNTRLTELRGQPELANPQMYCWAAYLRGQADALDLPVIDTTTLESDAVTAALVVHIERARGELCRL